VLQECHKSVTRVLQECYSSVTRVINTCGSRVGVHPMHPEL
jgi:hypothetical protein